MVHVCVNGSILITNNYSSPVPVVGLYIAAASFLCFLLIVCDMWAGFQSKKFWFPCRLFSINSITLSLIPIATKLPVDLTTAMPSAQDQLSKLGGTIFICMTMGFMLPSLSVNAQFESFANVTALSIFVVTIAVNIRIQMATGAIFSFFVEHAIILVCMLMLLLKFWTLVATTHAAKEDYTDKSKDHIREGGNKILERLQDIKFCGEASDYGWSVWLVVVSQVLTVAAVSLVVGLRWLTNPLHFSDWCHHFDVNEAVEDPYIQFQYVFSSRNIPIFLEKCLRYVLYYPLGLISYDVGVLNKLLQFILGHGLVKCGFLNIKDKKDTKLQEFETLLRSRHIRNVETWVRKSVANMERLMKINRKASFQHLIDLLLTIPPSEESLSTIGLSYRGVKISTLSVVLLVETAKATIMPTIRNKVSLANILAEVFDIIHFVDSKLYMTNSIDRLQYMSAQIVHEYGFAYGVGEIDLVGDPNIENNCVGSSLSPKPIWIHENISADANADIRKLLRKITGAIFLPSHASREIVCGRIKQLFVDMLHIFLTQLPIAIFTHIDESPAEKYQERVRLGLGFLCKVQSLEPYIRFSLLPSSGITSLFGTETGLTDTQVEDTQVQG